MADPLSAVGDELERLARRPLEQHPEVLARLHDELAGELDRSTDGDQRG